MKILTLVPAYNEAKNINNILAEIKRYLPQTDIMVINDGSEDKTAEILENEKNIAVLHLSSNLGIGGAILAGFYYFLEREYDALIRIDGDGQHPPEEGSKILEKILTNEADLVIGSRFIEKRGYLSSKTRLGGIKLLNYLTSFILKINITDNTSGFRAYNQVAIRHLVNDYPFDYPEPIEVYSLAKKGLRIIEVPAMMRERQAGLSSISHGDSYAYMIKVLLTIFIKYIIGEKK